jgi:hypothetical protein
MGRGMPLRGAALARFLGHDLVTGPCRSRSLAAWQAVGPAPR